MKSFEPHLRGMYKTSLSNEGLGMIIAHKRDAQSLPPEILQTTIRLMKLERLLLRHCGPACIKDNVTTTENKCGFHNLNLLEKYIGTLF
ncbi:hypothetical protein JI721_05095 [Alicyclobacillus cycloheptanicus]|uniref:Uncharacterized protein n=1 Tax=Alicyclobacillus cycloheptanicus TaxID=1457 RepID=A0ABT9XJE4_9BACL|nr:hypothetical protein [Alicyclobacillus cycloheptanicus]MDQ0189903.1 hypothetical protein [Alicyclobacillus cycloheptanicus]WDM02193.1 hypothetical protein JI721_05095 [Alicyclobacillus cycloheptanicus]